jgi:hypothetical protein
VTLVEHNDLVNGSAALVLPTFALRSHGAPIVALAGFFLILPLLSVAHKDLRSVYN